MPKCLGEVETADCVCFRGAEEEAAEAGCQVWAAAEGGAGGGVASAEGWLRSAATGACDDDGAAGGVADAESEVLSGDRGRDCAELRSIRDASHSLLGAGQSYSHDCRGGEDVVALKGDARAQHSHGAGDESGHATEGQGVCGSVFCEDPADAD